MNIHLQDELPQDIRDNLGTRRIPKLPAARFPDADLAVWQHQITKSDRHKVDVLLVNPPSPDGAIWIRTQHRVGRRSRENMIWPQVSLAQMAALLAPDYSVEIIDAIAERMRWDEFERILRDRRPKYYLTQCTAPTLTNDMYGVFLARSLGAKTMAFGTHVTPMVRETLQSFPALDYVLRGEPELTLRELIDAHENRTEPLSPMLEKLFREHDPTWQPINSYGDTSLEDKLARIKGLGWRRQGEITVNWDRPFIKSLDDLPIPRHDLLPLDKYRMPMIKGPYTFIVTSRGCPAGCKYCIKHVSYQYSVRLRSPELLIEEIKLLNSYGIYNIHMYADLFTVNRDQVVNLCKLILQEGLKIKWTCNSRVDYVDEEMINLIAKSGCWVISWGIESGNELILKRAHKGYKMEQAHRALTWARKAGIKNWGYFIIGLPGETVETIQDTIRFSKALPLDIALFHIAAPYPGTPFFFEVVENGWFRPGTRWEEVDMDRSTVLDYPGGLSAEELEYWQRRAFREWALRPGPILTFLKGLNTWAGLKSALEVGLAHLGWQRGEA
ncbi:MAG: radical SAM protein [Chloroflexota bacterium]